jgi:hypothetical protein
MPANQAFTLTRCRFLGWLTILHFGPNREVYPFFDFSEKDPYNYSRTAISSLSKHIYLLMAGAEHILTRFLVIWFFELLSSFFARLICNLVFKVDVTNT